MPIPSSQWIDEHFQSILDVLQNEKHQEKNSDFAREIAVTITETQKAYAYFVTYVLPKLKESEL